MVAFRQDHDSPLLQQLEALIVLFDHAPPSKSPSPNPLTFHIVKKEVKPLDEQKVNYIFRYEWNQPLTHRYQQVLSHWYRALSPSTNLNLPSDINRVIMDYAQYASGFELLRRLHRRQAFEVYTDDLINADAFTQDQATVRGHTAVPINSGQYSFSVTFRKSNDDKVMNGDTLSGLNFIGVCNEKYSERKDYVLLADRRFLYGFGDDNPTRGWVTWRYFGDNREPLAWWECVESTGTGGFGHNDRVTLVVDLDQGWIRGYKNGKRWMQSEVGDIDLTDHVQHRFYPLVSSTNWLENECCISFGPPPRDD